MTLNDYLKEFTKEVGLDVSLACNNRFNELYVKAHGTRDDAMAKVGSEYNARRELVFRRYALQWKKVQAPQPFKIEDYNRDQINFVHDLYEQALKAGAITRETTVSGFMVGFYFRQGYDIAFHEYWKGQKHKPKWGDIPFGQKKSSDPKAHNFCPHKFP